MHTTIFQPKANLEGADLRNYQLAGVHLAEANLKNADLRGTSLVRADLRRADLRLADLMNADLRWANLAGALLGGADFRGANLAGATAWGEEIDLAGLPAFLGDYVSSEDYDQREWNYCLAAAAAKYVGVFDCPPCGIIAIANVFPNFNLNALYQSNSKLALEELRKFL